MIERYHSHEPNPATDASLLERIARGDCGALGLLYDRHAALVLGVAIRVVRDSADAEDVVHDAFVAVFARASTFSLDRGSVLAWLITLARNLGIDRLRRRNSRRETSERIAICSPPAPAASPEMIADHRGLGRLVRQALASLRDPERHTLLDAFFGGATYAELAERDGVPLGTVKSRAARAIATLREALAQSGISTEAVGEARLTGVDDADGDFGATEPIVVGSRATR